MGASSSGKDASILDATGRWNVPVGRCRVTVVRAECVGRWSPTRSPGQCSMRRLSAAVALFAQALVACHATLVG
jgi:hypothetical protein